MKGSKNFSAGIKGQLAKAINWFVKGKMVVVDFLSMSFLFLNRQLRVGYRQLSVGYRQLSVSYRQLSLRHRPLRAVEQPINKLILKVKIYGYLINSLGFLRHAGDTSPTRIRSPDRYSTSENILERIKKLI